MTNAELIEALRYCPSHGCGRCVALDANGRCTAYGVVGLMHSAADLIEAQQARIAELSLDNKMLKNTIDADKGVMLDRIRFLEAQLPKEGEWVGRQKHRRCSICGFSTWYDFALDCELTSPFCPECGARMKGEQE